MINKRTTTTTTTTTTTLQTFHLIKFLKRIILSFPYNCFQKTCLEREININRPWQVENFSLCPLCSDIEQKQTQRILHSLLNELRNLSKSYLLAKEINFVCKLLTPSPKDIPPAEYAYRHLYLTRKVVEQPACKCSLPDSPNSNIFVIHIPPPIGLSLIAL